MGALSSTEISHLKLRSVARNARLGLTGFVMLFRESYVGLLEGPADAVTAMVDRISVDRRNVSLEVLAERYGKLRRYRDWSLHVPGTGHSETADTRYGDVFAMRLSRGLYQPDAGM